METIKTIGVLTVLIVVGYLGYKAVTAPTPTPPREEDNSGPAETGQVNVPIPELPPELAQQSTRATPAGDQSSGSGDANRVVATGMQPPPAFLSGASSSPRGQNAGGNQNFGSSGELSEGASATGFASLPPQPAVGSAPQGSATTGLPQGTTGTLQATPIPSPSSAIDRSDGTSTAAGETPASAGNTDRPPSGIRKEFADFLEAAYRKLDRGEFLQVHSVLSVWFADPRLTPEEDAQLTDLLDQVAGTVVFSREHILEPPYTVQPGDTLLSIAERFNVTPELLAKINGIARAEDLRPGMTLKVVRGPFDAVIHLQRRELVLMLQGKYAGRFRVGLGTDARQCEGGYQVREKTLSPRYFTDSGVYEAGDPRNPLGPKWIGLEGRLGIHGTNNPAQFDNPQAPGAIFVSAQDMDDLFDILTIGSRVTIVR